MTDLDVTGTGTGTTTSPQPRAVLIAAAVAAAIVANLVIYGIGRAAGGDFEFTKDGQVMGVDAVTVERSLDGPGPSAHPASPRRKGMVQQLDDCSCSWSRVSRSGEDFLHS